MGDVRVGEKEFDRISTLIRSQGWGHSPLTDSGGILATPELGRLKAGPKDKA